MTRDAAGWLHGARDAITDVPGIRVGHHTDRRGATGCTVILCESAPVAAVDSRGGAPGTRETDVLGPANVVRRCHAIVLAGGSAFGLAAATGVMNYLAGKGIGFETTAGPIPIVSSAIIFDLNVGNPRAYPAESDGYVAATKARGGRVAQGSRGAGTGASVAKLLGVEGRWKGGVGTASVVGPRGLIVGALAVTNAVGNIVDPDSGAVVAGPRLDGKMISLPGVIERRAASMESLVANAAENTTLLVVATNATLEHHEVQRVAYQAHDGMARSIAPCHTFADGDVAFAVATSAIPAEPGDALLAGAMAVRAVECAVLNSVRFATTLAGVPAVSRGA